jgi:catalase
MKKTTGSYATSQSAGRGGESYQRSRSQSLTDNFAHVTSDNQNSLKAGARGPTLLEDFVLREKIFHFDHERIPERIVHARDSGAHGTFVCSQPVPELTRAHILQKKGRECPVFVRFSTVAGGAGSVDTPRDVRGFATKFYTEEGNWDLVGNNIPVFFIQDGIKFPGLVHSVKKEADKGYPQAGSAHDTFRD